MSTKSKLLAMTQNLTLPSEKPDEIRTPSDEQVMTAAGGTLAEGRGQMTKFPPVVPGASARTGPGQMLQFRGQMLAVEGEMEKLRERLKEHEGSAPTRKLDPASVVPSRWANRHPDSFNTPEFARLKQDIELAGGNVQPISVRPHVDQLGRYEIVFGHRRHRACSELGIAVLATIDSSAGSDLDIFSAMDRENRERADLSPFEQGKMYRRALDEKLYPSNRRLAESLGVSHTWVANVLLVADLPPPVIECFRSPLEVQHRHAKAIASAFEKDRKGILRRAEKIRSQAKNLSPASVVTALIGSLDEQETKGPKLLEVGGKKVGNWFKDGAGRLTIQLDAGFVSDENLEAVVRSIAQALAQ